MYYYQSKVFCIAHDSCATSAYICSKKMTPLGKSCSSNAEQPIAWGIFKDTCGKYKEKK